MRRVLFFLLMPVFITLLVFTLLTAASIFQLKNKKRKPEKKSSQEAVSAEVLKRYERESQTLGKIRKQARKDLTADKLVKAFTPAKGKEVPPVRTLVSWFRAVKQKSPDSANEVFLGLVDLWKNIEGNQERQKRLPAIEALMTQAILSTTAQLELKPEQRAGLFRILRQAAGRDSELPGAILLLFARIGDAGDIPKLEKLKQETGDPQFRSQLAKVLKALQKRYSQVVEVKRNRVCA